MVLTRAGVLTAAACILAGGIVCGCGKARQSVTMAGSTAFLPFAEVLAETFMAKRDDVAISVQGGGSVVGIRSTISGIAQIGMADLVDLPDEAKTLKAVVVARDGVVMVVHPQNTVSNITMEQIRGVFNGAIRNWKEVGGFDKPITVVSRESGSGTRLSFEKIVGGLSLTKDAMIQDSTGTIRETVAQDVQAIGYLSHGLLNEKVKAVAVDGSFCTSDDIAAGRYKLVRPVFLLTKGEPAGVIKDFLDYVLGAEGQALIKEKGLLPVR